MKYKVYEDIIAVRLDVDDEIMDCVKKICVAERVGGAYITAIGATKSAVTGVLDLESGKYVDSEYEEFMELTSLVGNATVMAGEPYVHLHATFARHGGQIVGGHLKSGVIGATCELFIHRLKGELSRVRCEKTGLNIFDI